jgi:hypothetical protein
VVTSFNANARITITKNSFLNTAMVDNHHDKENRKRGRKSKRFKENALIKAENVS